MTGGMPCSGRLQGCSVQQCWPSYVRAVGSVDRRVNDALGRVGAFVARRPVAVLISSVVIALICSTGLFRLSYLIETDAERLWCVTVLCM
jgi:hypothetical protein